MWHAIRGEDGRGPRTALTQCVRDFFSTDKVEDVAIGIHKGKIPDDDLNGLAPVLLRASAGGDPVARGIVDHLAEEISNLALTAMRRLDLTGLAVPVVLGGGVITARDRLLLAGITERISAAAPSARLRVIDVPPVVGAALLGLDHIQAAPEAESRLRATYTMRT
jgi:N-acetylglucosamine kinase-like BadF-type ATPase